MSKSNLCFIWFVACAYLLVCRISTKAALIEVDHPLFGPDSLTVDTQTGLVWLDLPISSGFSYLQALDETGPGRLFEGFRHATSSEILGLVQSAGIPDFGYYPDYGTDFEDVLSLISLVGATSSNYEYPVSLGISGTFTGPDSVQLGTLSFVIHGGVNSHQGYYVNAIPDAPGAIAFGSWYGTSSVGNWLVIPEPGMMKFGFLGYMVFFMYRFMIERHNVRTPGRNPTIRKPHPG